MPTSHDALHESHLSSLPLLHKGKVRDIYSVGSEHLLIVTTDRISAFDVILSDPIPGKGAVLTTLPVIAAYVYLQKYMVEGLTAGSVKG